MRKAQKAQRQKNKRQTTQGTGWQRTTTETTTSEFNIPHLYRHRREWETRTEEWGRRTSSPRSESQSRLEKWLGLGMEVITFLQAVIDAWPILEKLLLFVLSFIVR